MRHSKQKEQRDGRRRYGSVPPGRRRLLVVACIVIGLIVVVAGIVISWAAGRSVEWAALVVAAGVVAWIYALYLWIRLSD